MLRVGFAYIWPEKEARLRSWLQELQGRLPEVRETFQRETVRHEQIFVIKAEGGPLLVYVMEAENHEAAKAAYAESPLSIDKEHQAVLEECLRDRLRIEPDFECSVPREIGSALNQGADCTSLVQPPVADVHGTNTDA